MMTEKVYAAINAVQTALVKEGISKDRKATGFGAGYQYRGIDDIYNALSPLLAEHGLVIIPRCTERHESQRPSGDKILYFVVVRMEFDFVCAEDGSKHTACTYGEAMDSGDKATNKAMSIAYKYACFQTFAIPTEGDDNDPDAHVHAPGKVQQPQPKQQQGPTISQGGFFGLTDAQMGVLKDLTQKAKLDGKAVLAKFGGTVGVAEFKSVCAWLKLQAEAANEKTS